MQNLATTALPASGGRRTSSAGSAGEGLAGEKSSGPRPRPKPPVLTFSSTMSRRAAPTTAAVALILWFIRVARQAAEPSAGGGAEPECASRPSQ
eukprot:2012652-Prymnesium_polylepis.2